MAQLSLRQWRQSFGQGSPGDVRTRFIGRLIVGLIQGIGAYAVYRLTKGQQNFSTTVMTLALVTSYAPPVWLAALGQIKLQTAALWSALVTVLIVALGYSSGYLPDQDSNILVVFVCLPAALFCMHHLVIPALRHRSVLAPYTDYYETAWKAGIQLVLALMFTGVFWGILFLGSLLFNAIGIDTFEELITKPEFYFIVTPVVFALGVELSDVRDGLTQGIRTVVLTLLSWLLPLAALIATAFLVALLFAGLSKLESSLSPSGLMLSATAGLIILMNTVYQDGAENLSGNRFLRLTLRYCSFLIVPMTAFAVWAVAIRIAQYGLTVPRIVAMTSAIIGLLYAAGYSLSHFVRLNDRDGWLPVFQMTNILAGTVTAITLIAYSTPMFNPIAIATNSQISRVRSGNIPAEDIPYTWLAWDAGPKGKALAEELTRSPDKAIAENAKAALEHRYNPPLTTVKSVVNVLPEGTVIPEAAMAKIKADNRIIGCTEESPCFARLYDYDADGREDVLYSQYLSLYVYAPNAEGEWEMRGEFEVRPSCKGVLLNEAIKQDAPRPSTAPVVQPIEFGEVVMDFKPLPNCPSSENIKRSH